MQNGANHESEHLIQICNSAQQPTGVVVAEPYIPHIPPGWNGILILGESQNLSAGTDGYVRWLEELSPEERLRRLGYYPHGNHIGVGPWDDGFLPLAMAAICPDLQVDACGVSNAVPWSARTDSGANRTPTEEMIEASKRLWANLLPELNPTLIITCGVVAARVLRRGIERAGLKLPLVRLRSPSPNYLDRVRGLFYVQDLIERYPEVQLAWERYGDRVKRNQRERALFFTCHAVSMAIQQRTVST